MGMWDFQPWANDAAADWFGDTMEETKLRDRWLTGIDSDPEDDFEVVRAAAWLFIQIGRVYVWPITNYDEDLERTISALRSLLASEVAKETPELAEEVNAEIVALESRR